MKQKIAIITSIFLLTFGLVPNAKSQWFDSFCTVGTKIFAGSQARLIVSSDTGATWTTLGPIYDNRSEINALAVIGSKIFAATDSGVFRSIDTGVTWTKTTLDPFYVSSLPSAMRRKILRAFPS